MKVAAWKNYKVLQSYNMDIGWALAAQPFSTLTVGSEFQPMQLLEPLLSLHPLWPCIKTWLTTGADYPLLPISDKEQREDLDANLARSNHKSAALHLE
jgi:hypothetical protein